MTNPIASNNEAINILSTSAILNGYISSLGDLTNLKYFWRYWPQGGILKETSKRTASIGPVSVNISGLDPNTKYYVQFVLQDENYNLYWSEPQNGTFRTLNDPNEPEEPEEPNMSTSESSNVTSTSATLYGHVLDSGSASKYYFEYWKTGSEVFKTSEKSTDGLYLSKVSANIYGLDSNTEYFYELRLKDELSNVWLGGVREFTTLDYDEEPDEPDEPGEPGDPNISTDPVSYVSSSSVILNGYIYSLGGRDDLNAYFIIYKGASRYTSTSEETASLGSISATVNGLDPDTEYEYFLTVEDNHANYWDGQSLYFTTLADGEPDPPLPEDDEGSESPSSSGDDGPEITKTNLVSGIWVLESDPNSELEEGSKSIERFNELNNRWKTINKLREEQISNTGTRTIIESMITAEIPELYDDKVNHFETKKDQKLYYTNILKERRNEFE